MTKAERIAALIADEKSPFIDADKVQLEALTEDHLKVLAEQNRETRIKSLLDATAPKAEKTEAEKAAELKAAADKKAADKKAADEKAAADKKEADLKAAADKKAADEKKPMTSDEYLNTLPAEVATEIRAAMKSAAGKKTATIKVLKDSKRCDLSDEQLSAKSQDELDALVKLANLGAVDYSGRGTATKEEEEKKAVPRIAQAEQNEQFRAAFAKRAAK